MDMKKILIADTSAECCQLLSQSLENSCIVRVCHNGLEAEELVQLYRPDVLVMDLALPGMDGIALLQRIRQMGKQPKILLTTRFLSPYIENAIGNYNVDMVLIKPCNASVMIERILDLAGSDYVPATVQVNSNTCISAMLMDLEIPLKRRGFRYLEMCIEMYMENPGLPLTKEIYPAVAKKYHSQGEAVERAIRQVIHETWENRNDRIWRLYFYTGRDGMLPRPTNAEFISCLAERQRRIQLEQA